MKLTDIGLVFNSDIGSIDNKEKVDRIINNPITDVMLGDKYSEKVYPEDELIMLDEPIENYIMPFIDENYTEFKRWLWKYLGGSERNKTEDK